MPLPSADTALPSKEASAEKASPRFRHLLDQLLLCHAQELHQLQLRQRCGEHDHQLSSGKDAALHDENDQQEEVDVQTAFTTPRPSVVSFSDELPEQPLPSYGGAPLREDRAQPENVVEELEFDLSGCDERPPVMEILENNFESLISDAPGETGPDNTKVSAEVNQISRQISPDSQRSRTDFTPRELWAHDFKSGRGSLRCTGGDSWKPDSSKYDAAESQNEALNARRPSVAHTRIIGPCENWCIANPGGTARITWEIIAGLLIAYDMFKIPLGVYKPADTVFTRTLDVVSLIFWTLNIPASLTVGYVEDGQLITDPQRILVRYLKSWFSLDLIVVLPDWIFVLLANASSGDSFRLLRILRLTKFIRLLRILQLKVILDAVTDFLDSEYMDIVVSLFSEVSLLFCVNHFAACAWYAISPVETPGPTWTKEENMLGRSWEYLYFTSLHWSVTQFTPSSMSVQPTNLTERVFAVCIVFFGLIFFSYIVGSITSSLSRLRTMSTEAANELWLLRRFLKRNAVPRSLSRRILGFIEHAHSKQQERMSLDQVKMLRYLSGQMMAELQCTLNMPHLQVHPLFSYLSEHASVTVHNVAKDAVSRMNMAREDTLFLPDQRGQAMYFVKSGRMLYTKVLNEEQTSELVDADEDWISEAVLWTPNWSHVGQADAYTEVELVLVSPKPFEEILRLVRPVAHIVSRYALNFLKWLETQELSDVIQGDQLSDEIATFIPGYDSHRASTRSSNTTRKSIFTGYLQEEAQAL